ncbi:MAG: TRAP transporter large permease subunit [Neomegalonema sp.]|nr:TRAP transporter large permease subunit [Neomegalonema sp.]
MEVYFLLVLVVTMMLALGSGFPVAFALPGSAIFTIGAAALFGYVLQGDSGAFFAQDGPVQWLTAGVTNFRGVYWEVERDTLIAIPLFIFMGIMLQRSKIAEDLLVTMAQLFGPIPGGLGISVVFVGALLAATTGIVGATVVAMGLISLPAMLRNNYSKPLATGTIAASGTLGQIIPPSIVLIILADQLASAVDQASTARKAEYKAATGEISMPSAFDVTSTSAGDMFLGAFVPGLLLVALYMIAILVFALLRPKLAPAVHYDGSFDRKFWGRVLLTLVPPLALIFLVLGSIIAGVATVNQAGAIGAVGATMMAGYRLAQGQRFAFAPAILGIVSLIAIFVIKATLSTNVQNIQSSSDALGVTLASIAVVGLLIAIGWSGWRTLKTEDTLRGVMIETAKTTSLVFIILLGAAMLTAAFRAFGGEELVRDFLQGLPGGFWTQFFIVMAVIFVLGFFLDFIEIAVVVVPIVAPILLADPAANVTAVWLGVMIGLNIQTSFLTPPFGFALFYLRGVAPASVRTVQMYKGVIAFICLQLAALFIVAVYPPLVNYLPTRLSLTSDTAPPASSPPLQACIEKYVAEQMSERGAEIKKAIAEAKGLDYAIVPKKLRGDLEGSISKAEAVFPALEAIAAAKKTREAAVPDYKPVHAEVRVLLRRIHRFEDEAKKLEVKIRRFRGTEAAKAALVSEAATLKSEADALRAEIPADWDARHKAYLKLVKAEDKARQIYRRTVDQAYQPILEVVAVIDAAPELAKFEAELRGLKAEISGLEKKAAVDRLADVRKRIGSVAGARDIRRKITGARRALRARKSDPEKAAKLLDEAVALFEADMGWRKTAAATLAPKLRAYEAAIRDTIGLRSQPRLPVEQALYVASCRSDHTDISLNF